MEQAESVHLTLYSRVSLAIFFWLLALAVLALVMLVTLHNGSKHVGSSVIALVIGLAFAFGFERLAFRSFRWGVAVTPANLTVHHIVGWRRKSVVDKADVAAIGIGVIEGLGGSGRRFGTRSGRAYGPYAVLRDGRSLDLEPLGVPVEQRAKHHDRQVGMGERIATVLGVPLDIGDVPQATAPASVAAPAMDWVPAPAGATAPTYPAPSVPPPNYDPARYDGVPVPALPPLPVTGTAASWIPDPVIPTRYRYFDGRRWTEWTFNGSAVAAAHLPQAEELSA